MITEQEAYDYGKDCALNGANEENCHFSIFQNEKTRDAWQRGYDENKKDKNIKSSK